jgi:hypothetical protein
MSGQVAALERVPEPLGLSRHLIASARRLVVPT